MSESSHSRGSRPLVDRAALEHIYETYNRREFTHPDPVETIYRYKDVDDREVAALIAALLSLGRVRQILKSVEGALSRVGSRPARFIENASRNELETAFDGFRHRFITGCEVAATLDGARELRRRHGSLGRRLAELVREDDETVVDGLGALVDELERAAGQGMCGRFLPLPRRRSACKRLHLYLRWMVRCDDVDPGGWDGVSPSKLVVPLDTHMHRLGTALGLTSRTSADLRAALEITSGFREVCPEDPVRYDFALTRSGIHPDVGTESLEACGLMVSQ